MMELLPRGCKFEWTGQNVHIKFRGRYVVSRATGERKCIEVGANYFVDSLAFARQFEAGDEPEYVLENAFPNGTPQVT